MWRQLLAVMIWRVSIAAFLSLAFFRLKYTTDSWFCIPDTSIGEDIGVVPNMMIRHPDYDKPVEFNNDIMLLKLERKTTSTFDHHIVLNTIDSSPSDKQEVRVLGWASYEAHLFRQNSNVLASHSFIFGLNTLSLTLLREASISTELKATFLRKRIWLKCLMWIAKTNGQVVSQKIWYALLFLAETHAVETLVCCYDIYFVFFLIFRRSFIFIHLRSERKNSGGPLLLPGSNPSGDVQVGLTSWGVEDCMLQTMPGMYTRLSKYIGWMRSVLCNQIEVPEVKLFPPSNLCAKTAKPSNHPSPVKLNY